MKYCILTVVMYIRFGDRHFFISPIWYNIRITYDSVNEALFPQNNMSPDSFVDIS